MNIPTTKVVIVDDEEQFLAMMAKVAKSIGFVADTYSKAEDFWAHTYRAKDILILDLSMPGCDGIEFIRELSNRNCPIQIILCSGQDVDILKAAQELAIARNLNFITSLQKPVSIKHFKQVLLDTKESKHTISNRNSNFEISPARIKQAISRQEVVPYYQPQIDLRNGDLIGFEALCRWVSPEFGIVPPNVFLPIVQQNELLPEVTALMLDRSAHDIAVLGKALEKPISVSVNIEASDASSLDFPELVSNVIKDSGLAAELLMLEITESGMMGEMTDSLDILARLRMKGFSLSIDDFGTGYSSLFMLHKMPFNELKIDQTFVRTLLSDRTSLAIVETCILLAQKIGVLTVAEGIEDEQTYMILRDLGCKYGQGFYMGKPMPFSDIPGWIAEWQCRSQRIS